jgi:hypothetical protein
MRCFEFFNSVLIKNREIDSNFFRIFYFKFFNFFEIFKFNRPVFDEPAKPVSIGFVDFYKNWPVFNEI